MQNLFSRTLSRRNLAACIVTAALAASVSAATAQDAKKPHRLAVQVDTNDAAAMNLALNNGVNVARHYTAQGDEVEIEIVAFGPGLHMLRDDTSPVKARVKSIAQSMPYVTFDACNNTREGMKKAEGKDIPLVSQAKVVPSGVVRIMELQEQGWSYLRP
jgi:intracellular sulfur oxidation DsrE/DsrF family protein